MKKLFSYLILLFFFAALVPKAYATVGSITLDPLHDEGGGYFSATGTWQPRGNQCWVEGSGFHYKIKVVDLTNAGKVLTTINPAACNGNYSGDVIKDDRGIGGTWPAPGQRRLKTFSQTAQSLMA